MRDIVFRLLPVNECLRRIINRTDNRLITPNDYPRRFRPGKFGTQYNRQCEARQGLNLLTLLAERFQCGTKNGFILMMVWQAAVHHRELTDSRGTASVCCGQRQLTG